MYKSRILVTGKKETALHKKWGSVQQVAIQMQEKNVLPEKVMAVEQDLDYSVT